ncbi:MAG TPA: energy transducer TonB [Candidatus Acidoferrum sp.]|nr:energy transducer TonB [Candidatus Acidoferrum sp.]
MSTSLLLHCLAVLVIVYSPPLTPARVTPVETVSTTVERIYYQVPVADDPPKVPRIVPKGPGGQPGGGSVTIHLPALASTVQRPNITIVSNPVHPDNFHQTIFQPAIPPEVKITTDQKVPNIVMGQDLQSVKAPFDSSAARPAQFNRQVSDVNAPTVSDGSSKQPMMAFLKTSDSPQLTIPVSSGGAPIERTSSPSASSPAKPANAAGLMVLGVDPAPPNSQFSLPAGNRWGQFSIAPPPASVGSPGGSPSVAPSGGKIAGLAEGDPSKAVGPGSVGGGGGKSEADNAVSISGAASSLSAEGGTLDPALAMGMIYPIAPPPLNVRRNTMVISAGPIGGGGLNVYGALKCGKIYSVFLPMPDRNWTMQYCDSSAKPTSVSSAGYTTVLRLEDPLRPPDADLLHRFDFKRIPVPIDKAHRSIILKGTIAVDGTVQHVVVYQGLLPKMDEAARLAFSRWRFKPATRDGKPVAVEVLVGIPPEIGQDRISR